MARTIFDRYGGFRKISRIVISFYEKMTTSPLTKRYFENINMKRLIDHQTKFISSMMGGPASYTNEHLERVHAHLGITEEAFSEAVDLLTETLEDHAFDDADVSEVENQVMVRKNHIVQKTHD
ncbi:MAG: group 1 truncated hemoglobin [Anaerolineales bacterium]|jgi:hemoglobin